jgi:hypothetical protein
MGMQIPGIRWREEARPNKFLFEGGKEDGKKI